MSRFRPIQNAQPDTEYATCADFCETLAKNLKPLYLLAFLLTGRHTQAEQCFLATLQDCVSVNCVFKGWERPWSKRCLIINAVRLVFCGPAESGGEPDPWCEVDIESRGCSAVNALTRLAPPLQRFVFVMSVLEGCSEHECALLLGRTPREVVEARTHALRQLSRLNLTFTEAADQNATHDC